MLDNKRNDVISVDEVVSYLKLARDSCGSDPIIDIHVHATEVIRDTISYQSYFDGLCFASNPHSYKSPEINAVRVSYGTSIKPSSFNNKLSELAFTKAYQYSGPRVLMDQMDMAGVDVAALLPVAGGSRDICKQMEVIRYCCEHSNRFLAGYSLSDKIPLEDIGSELEQAVSDFGIRLVKIHPNLSGIDLASAEGVLRIETILRACNALRVPALIHGGCSPILGDSPARKFGAVANLRRVDWSITEHPVVIAHFGIYGCDIHSHEPPSAEKKEFAQMLNEYPHLYTDTSGVAYEAIECMLNLIDYKRVVFGSDALYVPIYRQLVYLIIALKKIGAKKEIIRAMISGSSKKILDL